MFNFFEWESNPHPLAFTTTCLCPCATTGLNNNMNSNFFYYIYFLFIYLYVFRAYDIVFERMTKWYLQIDPVFWLTNQCKDQKYFMRLIDEFGKKIIKHRMQKLSKMEEKMDILNSQEDSSTNTQLSVIDRFILSNELNYRELIDETFTIFTSVSNRDRRGRW